MEYIFFNSEFLALNIMLPLSGSHTKERQKEKTVFLGGLDTISAPPRATIKPTVLSFVLQLVLSSQPYMSHDTLGS